MNFNQLKYILAVDKHRNFSRAAEECEVAQSTLSREIQRLEKEFGILVFDRTKYPVVPTMKGTDLLLIAEEIIEQYRHFVEVAEKKDNLPSGDFKLGILSSLAPYLLPLFIPRFSQKYPHLNLKIAEMGERRMEEQFRQGQLDAALSIAPFFKAGYYEETLFEESFVLYLNEKHPLARKSIVKWEEIPFDELILQNDIKFFLLGEENRHPRGLSSQKLRNVAYENGSLETLRKVIDLNGGLTLLPHLSTLYMGDRRLKMVRKIEAPQPKRKIILVTPRGFEKNRVTKVLKREIIVGLPKGV